MSLNDARRQRHALAAALVVIVVWGANFSVQKYTMSALTPGGFLFALVVLATSVVTFPALLDRPMPAERAVALSLRATALNPLPVLAWGFIVALVLAVASIPFFLGLAVAVPVLGHATWHLYRRLVV